MLLDTVFNLNWCSIYSLNGSMLTILYIQGSYLLSLLHCYQLEPFLSLFRATVHFIICWIISIISWILHVAGPIKHFGWILALSQNFVRIYVPFPMLVDSKIWQSQPGCFNMTKYMYIFFTIECICHSKCLIIIRVTLISIIVMFPDIFNRYFTVIT